MADDLADCLSAPEVALLSNIALLGQMNEPDPLIVRNEIPNVLPVCEDQKLRASVRLLLETLNRFRKPLPSVPRQAQARHETVAARSPRELPGR
jgi:hypothetical protein